MKTLQPFLQRQQTCLPRCCPGQSSASSSSICSSTMRWLATGRARSVRVTAVAPGYVPDNHNALHVYTLPNGPQIRHTSSSAEVEFLYREHYQQRVYLQHQVSLQPGATVLDVGANIGLFAMSAAEATGAYGRVICVEPEPRAAAALRHNLQAHAKWLAAQGQQVAECDVIEAAAGDGSLPEAHLTVYKGAAGWSTLVRDDEELVTNMQHYITHMLQGPSQQHGISTSSGSTSKISGGAAAAMAISMQQQVALRQDVVMDAATSAAGLTVLQQILAACGRSLTKVPGLKRLTNWLARVYVQKIMMGQAKTVAVKTCTVSDIIRQYDLRCVDLLKVDVERAELAVLAGIEQHHWQIIRQFSMEVHDVGGQLQAVIHLLQQQGDFKSVVWDQDAQLQGSTLYNVYAVKKQ